MLLAEADDELHPSRRGVSLALRLPSGGPGRTSGPLGGDGGAGRRS